MDTTPFTVQVPDDRIPEFLTFLAGLFGPPTAPTIEAAAVDDARIGEDGVAEDALREAGPGLTDAAVRRNYSGGTSDYWRPFLELLAAQPDTWVEWSTLYVALGLTDRQCAGMLGAAERRCKGKPPYVKSFDEGQYFFWMPSHVAELVTDLAS